MPPKKEANPASLRSAAPSKGRGSRGHSLLPMEGGAPKGRRLDGGSGMKKSGKIVSSASLTKAPERRCAVPLPQWGRLRYESTAIPISSERIHACVKKQYPRQSLPRVGKVASGASRIGFWRYEKERRRSSQVRRLREHPSAAVRSPFPMGKAAIREYSFSRIVKANTGYVEKKNNDGQSLPLEGKVASKASRIGY